ncbi:hypothetical protein PSAC2689_330005 [Paraburkholderia sacchari]
MRGTYISLDPYYLSVRMGVPG